MGGRVETSTPLILGTEFVQDSCQNVKVNANIVPVDRYVDHGHPS